MAVPLGNGRTPCSNPSPYQRTRDAKHIWSSVPELVAKPPASPPSVAGIELSRPLRDSSRRMRVRLASAWPALSLAQRAYAIATRRPMKSSGSN